MAWQFHLSDYALALRRAMADEDAEQYRHLTEDFEIGLDDRWVAPIWRAEGGDHEQEKKAEAGADRLRGVRPREGDGEAQGPGRQVQRS